MDSNLNTKNKIIQSQKKDQEIDLKIILNFLIRNKKIIALFSSVFLISGYFYSFFPKKTWEGQFQIVLNTDKKKENDLADSILQNFGGLNKSNDLETEVEILKSPSVLMPVFEMVILKKGSIDKGYYEFSQWKDRNLIIGLQEDTSILNISYKDHDKNIILPVLEKMSASYQEASGRRKKRTDEASEKYLKEQIQIFKKKSSESLKNAQEFSIDQDLIFLDNNSVSGIPNFNKQKINLSQSFLPFNINIENTRVSSANEIKRIDLQIKKIKQLADQESKFIAMTIPNFDDNNLLMSLEKIEIKLAKARNLYTEDDITIKKLSKSRDSLLLLLKTKALDSLNARKLEAEAILEASSRPKDILLKYKELIRNASRDENTLIKLEDELRLNELNKSKQEEPWELITKPTLLKGPVGNIRSKLLFLGLVGGFIIGIFLSFIREKRSGIIFELTDLIKLFGVEFNEVINSNKDQLLEDKILFFREYINQNHNKQITLIKLGKIELNKVQEIKNLLSKGKKNNIEIVDSIFSFEQKENSLNFVILEVGTTLYSEVENFKKYEKLLNLKISGTLILEKNNIKS